MVLHLICSSKQVDKLWELLTKMLHYSKKGYKKVQNLALKRGVTKKIRKHLYMAAHVDEMKRLQKLKIAGNDVAEYISDKQ